MLLPQVAEVNEDDELALPPPRQQPEIVPLDIGDKDVIVVYDLETTGLGKRAEIMQIAASTTDKEHLFDKYILPVGYISSDATRITGLKKENGVLVNRKGETIPTVSLKKGMSDFISFLQKLKEANASKKIVLVGHNANAFDNKHLIRSLTRAGKLDEFTKLVAGFSDTLLLMKEKYPERKGKGAHSVGGLYELIVGLPFEAHNAAEDVRAVAELIVADKIKPSDFSPFSLTIQSAIENVIFNDKTSSIKQTLRPLYTASGEDDDGVIKPGMAEKIAKAGLSYNILLSVFRQGGETALRDLLKERVTRTNRIIDSLVAYFEEMNTGINERSYMYALNYVDE